MPRLVKNITCEVFDEKITSINCIQVESQVGLEDYASVYNFTGYLQNFTKVDTLTELEVTGYYGIEYNTNKTFIEIDISY